MYLPFLVVMIVGLIFALIVSCLATSPPNDWVVMAGSFDSSTASAADTTQEIFDYKDNIFSQLDTETATRLRDQRELDSIYTEFRPNLDSENQSTPIGSLILPPRPFFISPSALIYRTNFPEKRHQILVKYQAHKPCSQFAIHPLVREFWFQSEAFGLGIAPEPYFVSPAVALPLFRTRNTRFDMSSTTRQKYVDGNASVRFLVSKYMRGESIEEFQHEFKKGIVPLAIGASICKQLIQVLRQLHNENIVHGDIHPGNVMLEKTALGSRRVKLIDFGRAFFARGIRSNDPFTEQGDWYHPYLSHWQIQGLPWDKRDDIFKAVYTMALMVHPTGTLWEYEKTLSPIRLYFWKKSGFGLV